MVLSKSLFQIPGRGIPIGESITYNSQDGTNGQLGLSWHLGSDTSLTEKSDGSVIYVSGDGSSHCFTPNGNGGYNAPTDIYLTLQKDINGYFKITDKNQNVRTYSNGKPVQVVDFNNNITIYSYDANGRLCKLRDPSCREITYQYNSSGQLTSVTNPNNNSYQFTYQGNHLILVTEKCYDSSLRRV